MSLFEDVMSLAVQLPTTERERLAKALGLNIVAPKASLPMANAATDLSKTNPAAWRKAERGHAVLATDFPGGQVPPGPEAIRGMWSHLDLAELDYHITSAGISDGTAVLPAGSPAVVHTSVALGLALGLQESKPFWEQPRVEIRLATATYLKLLENCDSTSQKERVRAFVQPFAVLSLGPMASSKAAELMLAEREYPLAALDALIAATAIAHEIPLITRDPRPFQGIAGLQVIQVP